MSTANTRVLRNISSFIATPAAGNAITVASIMEVRLTDTTGDFKTGSDNDAAFRHWPGNFECSISVVVEDPLQAALLNAALNCSVAIVYHALANANANCTVSGVSFKQASAPSAVYSEQAKGQIDGMGGAISWA